MRFNATEHIARTPDELFRIVCDLGYWVPRVDADVVSMAKVTSEPLGAGTKWLQVLKAPGQTIDVDLWINALDPGRSVDVEFDAKGLKGTGTFSVTRSGDGADLSLVVSATAKPPLGWLMYPLIRRDYTKRERARLKRLKAMAESGELNADQAEALAPAR